MAADYVEQMRTVQKSGPYRLLGWSLGGVIAHAIATELQRQGATVSFLGILDAYPPTRTRGRHGADKDRVVDLMHGAGLGDHLDEDNPPALPRLVELLRGQGGFLAGFDEAAVSRWLEACVNVTTVLLRHTPGVFVGGRGFLHLQPGTVGDLPVLRGLAPLCRRPY